MLIFLFLCPLSSSRGSFSFKSICQFFHYWVAILRYLFKFCEFILLKSNLQCNSISSFLKNASAASSSSHFLVMFPAVIINMRGNRVLWLLIRLFSPPVERRISYNAVFFPVPPLVTDIKFLTLHPLGIIGCSLI